MVIIDSLAHLHQETVLYHSDRPTLAYQVITSVARLLHQWSHEFDTVSIVTNNHKLLHSDRFSFEDVAGDKSPWDVHAPALGTFLVLDILFFSIHINTFQ
jgi:hypothetical protein